tara:strand:+ start:11 stop:418 length:408 start_codon:yes stop_codon:yes gene_type:complete
MVKLLLIGLGLFVFSCDSSSPTEVTTEGLVDSVCGYDDFEYLSGCGAITQGCTAYGVEGLAVIADGYCVMAGYTNAVSYDSITVGPVQNVLNIGCDSFEANPDYYSCDNVEYCNGSGAWGIGGGDWPVISNLVCE